MKFQKINWQEIYSFYISSEKVSYSDCALQFNISIDSIKKKGGLEDWTRKKQEIFRAALAITEQKAVQELVRRNESHIALGLALQSAAVKQMTEKNILPSTAKDVKDWIVNGVAIERKARGMDQNIHGSLTLNAPQIKYHIVWGDGSELGEY